MFCFVLLLFELPFHCADLIYNSIECAVFLGVGPVIDQAEIPLRASLPKKKPPFVWSSYKTTSFLQINWWMTDNDENLIL